MQESLETGAWISQLRSLCPQAFVGERLDLARLRQLLGPEHCVEGEHFGLSWAGKAEAARVAQLPSGGALLPVPAESVGFEDAPHLFLEGDNMEVLKLLQRGYAGRVRLVFIDPPYNTGGDFVYPDDYRDGLKAYMALTGQAENGRRLTTLAETDGRYHSRWLSMMLPRLILARQLLEREGFLFVTIDDHEVHTLRMLLGEVFGEESFVAHVIWQKKYTRSNDACFFSATHDHLLVFAKDKDAARLNLLPRTEVQLKAYANPDGHPKGPWKATPLHARSGQDKDFRYTFRNGVTWAPPPGTYPRYSKETLAALEAQDAIWFGADGRAVPSRKSFLSDVKGGLTPTTIWTHEEAGHTHEANQELKDLIGEGAFDTPKPTRLLRRILELTTRPDEECVVLDFFAGSGTTGQAVLELNAEDGGRRRFVLVQLPEPTGDSRYPTIAEVAKARLRKVLERQTSTGSPTPLTGGGEGPPQAGVRGTLGGPQGDPLTRLTRLDGGPASLSPTGERGGGFRVFRLGESAFRRFEGALEVETLSPAADPLSVVFELAQREGLALTVGVEEVELCGHRFFDVAEGTLLVCLERSVSPDAWPLALSRAPGTLIARDSAFAGDEALHANLHADARRRGIAFRTV